MRFVAEMGNKFLVDCRKYFERATIIVTEEELSDWYWDTFATASHIIKGIETGYFAKHHPKNMKGGCQFFSTCTNKSWDEVTIPQGFRVRGNLNPELEGVGEA
jgi:hypothetical protein